jgi:hypothetical protein
MARKCNPPNPFLPKSMTCVISHLDSQARGHAYGTLPGNVDCIVHATNLATTLQLESLLFPLESRIGGRTRRLDRARLLALTYQMDLISHYQSFSTTNSILTTNSLLYRILPPPQNSHRGKYWHDQHDDTSGLSTFQKLQL